MFFPVFTVSIRRCAETHIVAKKDIKFKMVCRAKARSVQSSSFSLLGLDLSHEHIHIYGFCRMVFEFL